MFNFLGYLLNMVLILVIISSITRLYMNHIEKNVEEIPGGSAVKSITDWVLEKTGKILTVKEEGKQLLIVVCICVVLMGFFQAIFIK